MATQQAAPPPQNGKKEESAYDRLNRPARNHQELQGLLSSPSALKQIASTIPGHMKPERMAKIMLSAVLQTPKLMKVNQLSLLQTLGKLSELGLEPGSAWGHVYLVPFDNTKENRTDVNIIIGYKGLLELARRSGNVKQIESHVVYRDEEFKLVHGLEDERVFRHVPNLQDPRKEEDAYLVYCIARLKDGGEHLEFMTMDEVRKIRDNTQTFRQAKRFSKQPSGPWVDHFLQMARKTVIRRACNYLSLSAEVVEALELEHDREDEGTRSAARSIVEGAVSKPVSGEDYAAAMTARAEEEPEDAESVPAHDPETGEVVEPELPLSEQPEPDAGTVDHLLWRISRADAAALPSLIAETGKLSKDEPRRLEVSSAISARRKAVTP